MKKLYENPNDLDFDAFKNPQLFVTPLDKLEPDNALKMYNKGLDIGKNHNTVYINVDSTWSAGKTESFQRFGVDKNTKDLLQGFIDSGTEILVTRMEGLRIDQKVIQENINSLETPEKGLQTEATKKLKEQFPEANFIKLQNLENGNVLSQQVKNTTLDKVHLSDLETVDNAYKTKDNTLFFVLSDKNIYDVNLANAIKNSFDKIESGANLILKTDPLDIPYMSRENPVEYSKDNIDYLICIQPKQHHQDQQRVMFITKDDFEKNLKNDKKSTLRI